MTPNRILMPLVSAVALTACSGPTLSGIRLEQLPPAAREPCTIPPNPPARDLVQAEAEQVQNRDLVALTDCARKHALVVAHIARIEAAIRN